MSQRFYLPIPQIFTDLGVLAPGWKLYFYETLTTTPKAVYSDTDLTIELPNPVLTNDEGHLVDGSGNITSIYYADASMYKAVLKDENDVEQWTADPCDVNTLTLANLSPRPAYYAGVTTGTSSAYVLDANPPFTQYSSTDVFELSFHLANAANPTIQYAEDESALNLVKKTGQGTTVGLIAGDLQPGGRYWATNNGSDVEILNPRTMMTYLGSPPTLTVSSNTLTLTNAASSYNVNTGSGAQTINTISGLTSGQTAVIGISSNSNSATFTSGVGNVVNPANISIELRTVNDKLTVYNDGTNNIVIGVNSAGATPYQLLDTQTASASASLNFTTQINSNFSSYKIELINVLPTTDATWLLLQFSIDGSTWITANYQCYMTYLDQAGPASNSTVTNGIFITADNGTSSNRTIDNASTNGVNGTISISAPSTTTKYKQVRSIATYFNNSPGAITECTVGGAYIGGTQAILGFRIIANTGTLASGTAKLYGIV